MPLRSAASRASASASSDRSTALTDAAPARAAWIAKPPK
jgi:hypothetical protein